jgi:hypothetical protein
MGPAGSGEGYMGRRGSPKCLVFWLEHSWTGWIDGCLQGYGHFHCLGLNSGLRTNINHKDELITCQSSITCHSALFEINHCYTCFVIESHVIESQLLNWNIHWGVYLGTSQTVLFPVPPYMC